MNTRGAVAILVLAVWVLLGPVAMAFAGCATMAAMCEGPCGTATCVAVAPTLSSAPDGVSSLEAAPDRSLPANILASLEHPPKSLLRSA